jgi:putative transposase
MQQIITAKLKLTTTLEQFAVLRQTQLAYRDALNAVSQYAFKQGKTSSVIRLHKGTGQGTPLQFADRAVYL